MQTINSVFKEARRARGLSLQALGGKHNFSALDRFENGKSQLDVTRMLALMESLGLNFLDVRGYPGLFQPDWQCTYAAILAAMGKGETAQAQHLARTAQPSAKLPAHLAEVVACLLLTAADLNLKPLAKKKAALYLEDVPVWHYLEFQLVQQVGPQWSPDQSQEVMRALLERVTPKMAADPAYLYRGECAKALLVILRPIVLAKDETLWTAGWQLLDDIQLIVNANLSLVWSKKVLQGGHTWVQTRQKPHELAALMAQAQLVGADTMAAPWQQWLQQLEVR